MRLASVVLLLIAACGDDAAKAPASSTPDAGSSDSSSAPTVVTCPVEPEVAVTKAGCVRGAVTDNNVIAFEGIPFAAPPIGALRWKPPAPATPWAGVKDTLAFSKYCIQGPDSFTKETHPISEDCLTLNVFRPKASPQPLPVMVWFHGGGLYEGGSAAPMFDGRFLAERGQVVVVTVNYRLGALGYLAHPALSAEDTRGVSGNYGLLDQIAALEWVRDNIASFGGDPNLVTGFGNSAGGVSVCTLLGTPLAKGLLHRGIIQGAKCPDYGSFVRSLRSEAPSAETQGVDSATKLGCSGADALTCMRSKTADEILAKLPANELTAGALLYGYTVDGVVLTDSPRRTVLQGKTTSMPVLGGIAADEGTAFAAGLVLNTAQEYEAYVRLTMKRPEEVLALYPAAQFPSPKAAYSALLGDFSFTCPHRQQLRAFATTNPAAYSFHFAQLTAVGLVSGLGVHHGAEQEFVFGTVRSRAPNIPTSPEELALSDAMIKYWSTFARTGDPGDAWPKFERTSGKYLNLGTPIEARENLKQAKCDLLEQLQ